MSTNPINGLFLTTTPVIYQNRSHATGFFFHYEEETFLVTNRHVLDEKTKNGRPIESVTIYIRNNPKRLDEFEKYELSLVSDGEKNWMGDGERVDLGIIPLRPPVVDEPIEILPPENIDRQGGYGFGNLAFRPRHLPTNTPTKMTISGGSGATILGYPLAYRGPAYPVARNAVIASAYGRTAEELENSTAGIPQKSFLTDAVTHPGLSGSPVVLRPPGAIGQDPDSEETVFRAASLMLYDAKMSLLGIHAGESDIREKSQLNDTVYPSAIIDILGQVESQDSLDQF